MRAGRRQVPSKVKGEGEVTERDRRHQIYAPNGDRCGAMGVITTGWFKFLLNPHTPGTVYKCLNGPHWRCTLSTAHFLHLSTTPAPAQSHLDPFSRAASVHSGHLTPPHTPTDPPQQWDTSHEFHFRNITAPHTYLHIHTYLHLEPL